MTQESNETAYFRITSVLFRAFSKNGYTYTSTALSPFLSLKFPIGVSFR